MTVNVSRFAYGLIVVLFAGATTLVAAAGQAGGPLEGAWFVAPLVGILTAIAAYLKREGGIEDSGE